MRNTISSLLIGIITFVLGVCTTIVWFRYPHAPSNEVEKPHPIHGSTSSDQPILAFCELANNPEKYSGKVVRVSATLSGFIHGMVLSDPNCSTVETNTAASYNAKNTEEIEKALEKVRGSREWITPVSIIATGEFRKVTPSNKSDTVYDTAPLQFEIISIENASKIN